MCICNRNATCLSNRDLIAKKVILFDQTSSQDCYDIIFVESNDVSLVYRLSIAVEGGKQTTCSFITTWIAVSMLTSDTRNEDNADFFVSNSGILFYSLLYSCDSVLPVNCPNPLRAIKAKDTESSFYVFR